MAEYFEQLFTVDPSSGQLRTLELQTLDANPPSIGDVKEAVTKLRGEKAAGMCSISAELLKVWGEAMIRGLQAVLTAVWHSGTIPPDWSSLSGRGKGTVKTASTTMK